LFRLRLALYRVASGVLDGLLAGWKKTVRASREYPTLRKSAKDGAPGSSVYIALIAGFYA